MRFQALMPDVLHWLGITKIDNLISMSDMKYNAITGSGISVVRVRPLSTRSPPSLTLERLQRYELPEDLIPPDSHVEIDAKIAMGYYSTTRVTDLSKTSGRLWEEVHSSNR
jgi:GTP cyclohydrolase II